jgi:UDP-N-acetyl-D-galactosamine dehydrogenase
VDITDCWASPEEAHEEYGVSLEQNPQPGFYDALLLAVPHREYAARTSSELRQFMKPSGVLFDLKGVLPLGEADLHL